MNGLRSLLLRLRRPWVALAVMVAAVPAFAGPPSAGFADAPVRIGVLAYRGKDRARQDWQPHADYLEARLPKRHFVIVPLTLAEFRPAIAARQIDLAITNTGHYVELEAGGSISRIATMRVAGPSGPVDRFGGTAIARSDRNDIRGYADLKGKRIATPDAKGFGGWQLHLRDARAAGLDLARDLGAVLEVQAHDKVVAAVVAGEVDAGFTRSDVIESMVAGGKLDPGALKVIGERHTPGFPYRHSTQLYPHWPFATLDHVADDLKRDLLIALLSLPADHPAARAAGIHGWTLPQNYQSVHELFLEFRLPPYDELPVEIGDVATRYARGLMLVGAAIISFLLVLLWWVSGTNRELRRSRDRLQLAAGVFQHAQEGIVITDAAANIIDVNDTFVALTGYHRDEALGRNPRFLASGEHDVEVYRELWNSLEKRGFWRGDLVNRRKDGTRYVQQTSISAVKDAQGRVRNYVGLSSDITALRDSQQKLEQMAYYDALTGLPNRRLLSDRLKLAIAQAARGERLLAICYLDLDGFKPINDQWGHAAGDVLLVDAARRLMNNVRAGDTVSRLGGDEFVVLLGNLNHFDECEVALERIRHALNRPFLLKEGEARVSASMGVTLFPIDGAEPDMLLRHADQAMYQAKQAGRNRYALFDAEHDKLSQARRDTLTSLQQAIDEGQLRLYYQPQVDMRRGTVLGFEALIRWQHPERGLLDPGQFLPMVDFVGLHARLGAWVIETALDQAAQWERAGLNFELSINIAPEQLLSEDFIPTLDAALNRHPDLAPGGIELELLESAVLDEQDRVAAAIAGCDARGVSFAIDDFGTGYSSMTYLKRLRAATLKIDSSFVRGMLGDPDDLSIVDSIIGLGTAFRRKVVAEGVETLAHGTMLMRLGCDIAQGYAIAAPMPAHAVPAWVRDWKSPPEWQEIAVWPRADLPLLMVEVDHLSWIDLLTRMLENPTAALPPPPPLNPHECRFGQWLESNGRTRYAHYPSFTALVEAHEAVHAAGREIELLSRHDHEAARADLERLHAGRDALLAALSRVRAEVLADVA